MKRFEFPLYLAIILVAQWINLPNDPPVVHTPGSDVNPPTSTLELPPAPPSPGRSPGFRGPRIIVEDNASLKNTMGTAFGIDTAGLWITARHVAGGCGRFGFAQPGKAGVQLAKQTWVHPQSDMALIEGPKPRAAFRLAASTAALGTSAFHIGFPQGKAGDVLSKVMGPARMITRGRYRSDEPVVAYAEVTRHPVFSGSLGGLSGGPIFNSAGRITGVTVAESPRRGRIIGTVPQSFTKLFVRADRRQSGKGISAPRLTPDNLKAMGDRLRRGFSVARVHCIVS